MSGDDEKLCDMSACPEMCTCRGTAVKCDILTNINKLSTTLMAVILIQTTINRRYSFGRFSSLLYLNATKCSFVDDIIDSSVFATSVHIISLVIIKSGIKLVRRGSFQSMIKLQLIDLHDNDIHEIYSYGFMGLLSMVDLNLNRFGINKLHDLSFFGMTNLKHLDLSANRLTTITYSMCHGLMAIQTIDLSLNEIMFLEPLRLMSIFSIHTVTIHLDTVVYCCSLFKSISCFVNESIVKKQNCYPLVKTERCFINIICSLCIILSNIAIFNVKKSSTTSSTHYTMLKQLLLTNLLQFCYSAMRGTSLVFVRDKIIYLNTLWVQSILCNVMCILLHVSFATKTALLFILVLDQIIAVKYTIRKQMWAGRVTWCLFCCWLITTIAAVSQQLIMPNTSPSCVPFLLMNSDTPRLIAIWSWFFITACLVAAIPVMYRIIAAHVKASNISVRNTNMMTNQRLIIRNGVIITAVGVGSWLPMFVVAQYSYVHPEKHHTINILVDIAVHSSEVVFTCFYCYKFKILRCCH